MPYFTAGQLAGAGMADFNILLGVLGIPFQQCLLQGTLCKMMLFTQSGNK
jgi:hypothetical protein